MPEIVAGSAGIVIEERVCMLVEGGYLHSMKLMIEKTSEPENPDPKKGSGSFLSRWRKRTPFSLLAPLKRLGLILLGGSFQG